MPELPEVESARRLVERHCLGKRILKATAADDDSEMWHVPPSTAPPSSKHTDALTSPSSA